MTDQDDDVLIQHVAVDRRAAIHHRHSVLKVVDCLLAGGRLQSTDGGLLLVMCGHLRQLVEDRLQAKGHSIGYGTRPIGTEELGLVDGSINDKVDERLQALPVSIFGRYDHPPASKASRNEEVGDFLTF